VTRRLLTLYVADTDKIVNKDVGLGLSNTPQTLTTQPTSLLEYDYETPVVVTKEIKNEQVVALYEPLDVPHSIMEREHLIGWTDTFATGTGLAVDPIEQSIFTVTNIGYTVVNDTWRPWESVKKNFNYFRCDAEMRIVLLTEPYQYGYVLVNSFPLSTQTTYNASHYDKNINPVYLDVASQQSVTLDLPWMAPFDFAPINEWDLTKPLWNVTLESKVRSVNSTGSTSIGVKFFVRLKNIKLFGPGMAQSSTVIDMGGPSNPIARRARAADKIMAFAKTMISAGPTIAATTGGGILGSWMSGPQPGTLYQPQDQEGEGATDSVVQAQIQPWGDLCQYHPRPMATFGTQNVPLGLGCYMGDQSTLHEISSLIMRPGLIGSYDMVANNTVLVNSNFATTTWNGTFLKFFASQFRFWRGSIKLLFYIFSSPFISGRVELQVYNDYAPRVYDTDDKTIGNIPSKVVEIKGSTVIPVTLPYLAPTPVSLTSSTMQFENVWRVVLRAEQLVSSGDAVPQLEVQVWGAAGEDFEFFSPCAIKNTEGAAQSSPLLDFEEPFECLGDTKTVQQRASHMRATRYVEELMARWSRRKEGSQVLANYLLVPSNQTDIDYGAAVDYLGTCFLAHTGPLCMRTRLTTTASGDLWLYLDSDNSSVTGVGVPPPNPLGGAVYINASEWRFVDFQAPYVHPCPALPIKGLPSWYTTRFGPALPYPIVTNMAVSEWKTALVRAGEGFRVFYPLTPPKV